MLFLAVIIANMITHKAVLEKMRTGQTFSIVFRTLNKQRKTGGVLKEYHTARLATKKVKNTKANHFKNHTFNIETVVNGHGTGELIKVHLPLVIFFNGESCTP